jgi:hypothetical protein
VATPDDAFFIPVGGSFEATDLTRGPWDPDSQHAGPPTALIAREIERAATGGSDEQGADSFAQASPAGRNREAAAHEWLVGRITFEILRPVPIDLLSVDARIVRPGRRVQHVEAELRGPDEELIRARAWLVRRGQLELPRGVSSEDEQSPARAAGRPTGGLGPPPGPGQAGEGDYFPTLSDAGYHTAMEYRFVEGSFLEAGPATTWMRMRYPLVAGEDPSPLQRAMTVADSGNGVGATLDFRRYLFVNVDLTVHLHRMPSGEWICLDSITVPEPAGLGIADTSLYDERGPIGRAVQTLLIAERDG